MKVSEIMSIFRAETKDKAKPYFVDELMALGFLNQAQSEAARRARLLVDSTSQEICRVQITAGEPVVSIDPGRVFEAIKAVFDGGRHESV